MVESPDTPAIGQNLRRRPSRAHGQCRTLLLPLLVLLGTDHPPLLLPACSDVHTHGVGRWWHPEAHGAMQLRGGAILNEDPELLHSERERKREQGQLKRSARETRRGQGRQSASWTGQGLLAVRSNPPAGAPLLPRSSRRNTIASGVGDISGLYGADAGTSGPEDEMLPQFTVTILQF